jgi:hypothetical protein
MQYECFVKVGPVVTCGAKSWVLTNKMEIAIMIWERKILRQIYGPTYGNGSPGIEMNRDIYNKFKSPDIITLKYTYCKGLGM